MLQDLIELRSTLKMEENMLSRAKRRRREEEEKDPPSQHELEREDRIERAKRELMTLKLVDLRQELRLFGKLVWLNWCRQGLWYDVRRREIVDWLANYKWLGEGSPFDLLPDELVLKIVKMASWDEHYHIFELTRQKCGGYDQDFIVESISHVNLRFNSIAR